MASNMVLICYSDKMHNRTNGKLLMEMDSLASEHVKYELTETLN